MSDRGNCLIQVTKLQKLVDKMSDYGVVPRWLGFNAACFYAGISERTMESLIISGDIFATWQGAKRIVDRLSIDAYYLRGEKELKIILEKFSKK